MNEEQGVKVLIMINELIIGVDFKQKLERNCNDRVILVTNATEGVDKLGEFLPDLILMSWCVYDDNGRISPSRGVKASQLCLKIREQWPEHHCPIGVISSRLDDEQEIKDAGCEGYVNAPVGKAQLVELRNALLRGEKFYKPLRTK